MMRICKVCGGNDVRWDGDGYVCGGIWRRDFVCMDCFDESFENVKVENIFEVI